jgi:hypothetical protein
MNMRAKDAVDGGDAADFEDDVPHPASTPPPKASTQAQTTERSIGSLYASQVRGHLRGSLLDLEQLA